MHESGMICDECSIKAFEKNFKTYAEGYVTIKDGQVSINWEKLLSLKKNGVRCETILWLLTDLGILSSDRRGNWSISPGHYLNKGGNIMANQEMVEKLQGKVVDSPEAMEKGQRDAAETIRDRHEAGKITPEVKDFVVTI